MKYFRRNSLQRKSLSNHSRFLMVKETFRWKKIDNVAEDSSNICFISQIVSINKPPTTLRYS